MSKRWDTTDAEYKTNGWLWGRAYHDHALRSDEALRNAARYLVANPIRAGIVNDISNYPYWDAIWLDPTNRNSVWWKEHRRITVGALTSATNEATM